eukprot:m51a1_g5252 hypothetical protein (206) ;mRNA; f:65315-66413
MAERALVRFSYAATTANETSVVAGEAVQVLSRHDEWVYVETVRGQRGMVPANYLGPCGPAPARPAPAAPRAARAASAAGPAHHQRGGSGGALPLQCGEPYILHDATGVHTSAAAGTAGMKVREEKFVFSASGQFAYEVKFGREGQSSSEMKTVGRCSGTFAKQSAKEVKLAWPRDAPRDAPALYPSLLLQGGALVSPVDPSLAFV